MSQEAPKYQTRSSINAATDSVGSGPRVTTDGRRVPQIGDRVRASIWFGFKATGRGRDEIAATVVGIAPSRQVVVVAVDDGELSIPIDQVEVVERTRGRDDFDSAYARLVADLPEVEFRPAMPRELREAIDPRAAAPDHAPFERGRRFVPEYYRPRRANRNISADADPSDIGEAYDLRPLRSIAIKYLVRAGRKPGQSAAKDLTKALEVIQRELEYLDVGGEAVFVSHVPELQDVDLGSGRIERMPAERDTSSHDLTNEAARMGVADR